MLRLSLVLTLLTLTLALTLAHGYSSHPRQVSHSFSHRREEWKSKPAISHTLIHQVNQDENSTWVAGINPHFIGVSLHDAAKLCGVSPAWMESYDDHPNPLLREDKELFGEEEMIPIEDLPDNYDVRETWAASCPIVNDITDQGACGSCWAVSAAATIRDRNCIWSNSTWNSYASATDILSCCGYNCGSCNGGQPDQAWSYWLQSGVVSGGAFGSGTGCLPYPIPPCDHGNGGSGRPSCGGEGGVTPYCARSCSGGNVTNWAQDKEYGYSGYRVGAGQDVQAIMNELYKRGSVQVTFYIYADFLNYQSGVYTYRGGQMLGGHAVKLMGWGIDAATQVPYWLVANTWNTDWGENGFFRIRRGTNECQIESLLFAGTPRLPTSVQASAAEAGKPSVFESKLSHSHGSKLSQSHRIQQKVNDIVDEVIKEVIEEIQA